MAKYRKKPVIVEATQWHAGDPPLPGMRKSVLPSAIYYVRTGQGVVPVHDGDWVIKEDGEYSICKPDDFNWAYEFVLE